MKNPFNDVPLNTKNIFVKVTAPDGCEIFIPVNSFDDDEIDQKKQQYQKWLDVTQQEVPDTPLIA